LTCDGTSIVGNPRFCSPLVEVTNAADFGGKASNLARVSRYGYRVPRTAVISRDGLRRFLSANQLYEPIAAHLTDAGKSEANSVFEELVGMTGSAPVPSELETEIREVAAELLQSAPGGLAVRSSAVVEDSETASFAGVFESRLGILSPDEVIEAVLSCWCALWSPRAVRYMARMGVEPIVDGMAVILQEVVPAASSGVIYTADPVSGNPWRFALQATAGLSVGLTGGTGAGDSYYVDWDSAEIAEREIVSKPTSHRATSEGVLLHDETAVSFHPAVSDEQVQIITRTARELDDLFDVRLDIEWAIDDKELWIVQARPMTALPTFFPGDLTPDERERSWQPALITLPLRSDQPPHLLTPLYRHYSESEMWHRYQPQDIIFTSIWRREIEVSGYRYSEIADQPDFRDYFEGPGEYEDWLEKNEPYYRRRWDDRGTELQTIRDRAKHATAETSTGSDLIPALLEVMDRLWDLNSFGWSGPQALGWMCEGALKHFLNECDIDVDVTTLLGGSSDSYTYQVAKGQQDLGREIRESEVVDAFQNRPVEAVVPHLARVVGGSAFLERLEAFCWRYGKVPPSWLDRPRFWSADGFDLQILSAIKNAWLGNSRDVEGLRRDALDRCGALEIEVRTALSHGEAGRLSRFGRLLEWARYWGQALNDRHGLAEGLLHERELVWHVGCRLHLEGLLETSEDVLVLERSHLERIARTGDPQSALDDYAEGLRGFRRARRLWAPPFLGAAPERPVADIPAGPPAKVIDADSAVLAGKGFGSGVAVGQARKVERLDGPELDSIGPDNVLVVTQEAAFHYADWHSLLTLVKAVVSTGRPSHHLAQVARECGVPLVGHVVGDLAAIPDGVTLRVDGSNGLVTPTGID
jgi:rifampicin phosphotransferase